MYEVLSLVDGTSFTHPATPGVRAMAERIYKVLSGGAVCETPQDLMRALSKGDPKDEDWSDLFRTCFQMAVTGHLDEGLRSNGPYRLTGRCACYGAPHAPSDQTTLFINPERWSRYLVLCQHLDRPLPGSPATIPWEPHLGRLHNILKLVSAVAESCEAQSADARAKEALAQARADVRREEEDARERLEVLASNSAAPGPRSVFVVARRPHDQRVLLVDGALPSAEMHSAPRAADAKNVLIALLGEEKANRLAIVRGGFRAVERVWSTRLGRAVTVIHALFFGDPSPPASCEADEDLGRVAQELVRR